MSGSSGIERQLGSALRIFAQERDFDFEHNRPLSLMNDAAKGGLGPDARRLSFKLDWERASEGDRDNPFLRAIEAFEAGNTAAFDELYPELMRLGIYFDLRYIPAESERLVVEIIVGFRGELKDLIERCGLDKEDEPRVEGTGELLFLSRMRR